MPDSLLLSADRILTPARELAPGWVRISGDRIVAVGAGEPPRPADLTVSGTLAPGFVDVHTHGGGGASFTTGDPEQAAQAAATHLAHGTTSIVASLVTDTVTTLERHVRALSALVGDGVLAGIHLEGPWLSPLHAGAHDPELLIAPAPADIDRLLAAGDGAVRMVTLAPELDGGLAAVRQLAQAGVVAATGHTDARYDVTCRAVEAGSRAATHLFNAERPLHHREPGPVAALLEAPDAFIELIADGVHVHPAALRLAIRTKPERFVLITDAMAAAGAPDGDYTLGPLAVQVRDGVARLASPDGTGAIAGSTLTLDAAVRFCVAQVGISLADAVRAATLTPARMLGLSEVGRVETGARADLVVLDDTVQVTRVMRGGQWVG